jgi:hypothetical protein
MGTNHRNRTASGVMRESQMKPLSRHPCSTYHHIAGMVIALPS